MCSRPLVAFFVIAISITWLTQILGLVLAQRTDLSLINEDNLLNPVRPVRLATRARGGSGLPALHPQVRSLGGRAARHLGRQWARGIAELWGRITKWRVEPRWYLIVFLLPLVLALISLAAGVLFGGCGRAPTPRCFR